MIRLKIGKEEIPGIIRKARRNDRLGIRFEADSAVLIVEAPQGKWSQSVEQFLQKKEKWILRQYLIRKDMQMQKHSFLQNLDRGLVPYLGHLHQIRFICSHQRQIVLDNDCIQIYYKSSDSEVPQNHLLSAALRARASEVLKKKTVHWAQKTQSKINQIRVKDQRTRWGSCSSLGNINLNWHLIFLDEPCVDYVIIHELMHLREMNHSQRFWKHVAYYFPNYKHAEHVLDQHRWLIGIFN